MTDPKVLARRCTACESGGASLDEQAITESLQSVPGWSKSVCATATIERTFRFHDYPSVVVFANAVAWMAQRENHHPVLELSYSQCVVRYSTHSIGGLSDNDFICAANANALFDG
jgi:4a-hydroxytetrahydrobiopterin dehydratase